jgi:tetratricopeptide (TPR) repeat protein
VHEQIAPSIIAAGGVLSQTKIPIVHVGYADGSVTTGKLERNLRLAELDCVDRPTLAATHYSRATTLIGLGRASEALVALNLCEAYGSEELIRKTVPIHRASALVLENEIAQALDIVTRAREHDPSGARLLLLEARLLAAVGDLAGAEQTARAQLLVGGDHLTFGVYDRGLSELAPRNLLAEILLVQGRFEEAAHEASLVIEARPTLGAAWITCGEALLRAGDETRYAEHRSRLEAIRTTEFARSLLDIEALIVAGSFEAAGVGLERLVAQHPASPLVLRAQARLAHVSRAPAESLLRAIRAALAVDGLCVRTRALERAVCAPAAIRGLAPHRRWSERAATALSPLVSRDD